ncbi:hypothetical protein GRI97_08570 [Altererythrobacter xixiisoli]|uniref:Uncharacterized protein n=1 Tax=Croceibacterium xixiisoli TaxID=1476466 RepID=A0A6I4TUY3_9SPHN|nr:hypothetical protein [Croceibacterium xixiisoli]MXO99039.1 hypothetical protein [Croceibacterium xixiisoli]
MSRSGSAAADDPVWQVLRDYRIGPPDASLTFDQRLARENGWNAGFANRVIAEYYRFCLLAIRSGHAVTPSDAVDQAWHLHLTYSRDYWERFCPDVLGAKLHHGPTAGGSDEQTRYYDQYAATLRSYEQVFGENPPEDIWPAAAQRFGKDARAIRVHPHEFIFLPRKLAIISAVLALLVMVFLGGIAGEWIESV